MARTVKPASDLTDRRTLEKLEIERQYYREREIDWGIVTERDLSLTLAQNVDSLRDAREYAIEGLPESQTSVVANALLNLLRNASEGYAMTCLGLDRRLGLAPGTALILLRHEIANGSWHVNMFTPLDPAAPLALEDRDQVENEERRPWKCR